MTMKTKSFFRFAVLLSSMLAAGSAVRAGGFTHSALNSGLAAEPGYVAAGPAGYQPVTMTSAEMPSCGSALSGALASPDMQYSGAQNSSRPMPAGTVSSGGNGQSGAAAGKRSGEPLNDYFDSFEVAQPVGIGRGMVYAGEYYPGVSCFPTVQSGLLPAEAKTFGKLFFDGWATGSVYDHNEWPVTNGFDENTEGRNSSVSPYQLSQVYVTMGREVEYADHLSIGGRIDALYGTDYLLASSLGLETENVTALGAAASNVYISDPHWNKNSRGGHPEYGLAIPQAYVEGYAPILSGFIAKVGHFYSPMGYESICSPNNFFHTHSYTKLYGQPQTVTGATGKLRLNPAFSVIAGAHQGWNVFDDNNGSWDMIGGIALEGAQGDSLTFIVSTGDAVIDNWYRPREREFDSIDGRQTSYSLVLEKHLCPEVTWVLEHDLGLAEEGAYSIDRLGRKIRDDARWYSVVNYLYFALDPTLELGARAEWFCDNGRSRLLAGEPTSMQKANIGYQWTGENVFDISLGLNWRPTPFLTVRPEVRWDYSDIEQTDNLGNTLAKGIYDNFTDDNRLTFGGDVILHF